MGNSENVRVGYAGRFVFGAPGVTFPVNPQVAWDADDFIDGGYISEDGVTTGASREAQDFYAWGFPNAPVRSQTTREEHTVRFTLIETTASSLSLYYGVPIADMTSTAAAGGVPQFISFTTGLGSDPDIRAIGLDVIEGDKLIRRCYPRAQVVDRGDQVFKSDSLVGWDITFKALLSSDGTSCLHYVSDVTLPS